MYVILYAKVLQNKFWDTLLQISNINQKYMVNIPKKYLNVYICLYLCLCS